MVSPDTISRLPGFHPTKNRDLWTENCFTHKGMKRFKGTGVRSPYGLELTASCLSCGLRAEPAFCALPASALTSLESIKHKIIYPRGAVLCVEGDRARTVFIICQGRVKLSTGSREGHTLITRVAEAGEVVGISAAVSGRPYEVTAETIEPSEVSAIAADDFLKFLAADCAASLRAAVHLSNNYHVACEQLRLLGLSYSARAKLARLILEWCESFGHQTERGTRLNLTYTHEEISHLIGVSRETVTRALSEFKQEKIIQVRGATLWVLNRRALETLLDS